MRHISTTGRPGRRSRPLVVLLVVLPLLQVLFAGAAAAGPVTGTSVRTGSVVAAAETAPWRAERGSRAGEEAPAADDDLRRGTEHSGRAAPFAACRAPAWHHHRSPATTGGSRAAFSPGVRGWWHPLPRAAVSREASRVCRAPAGAVRSGVLRC